MTQSASHRWSVALLILTTLIWGTTFPLIKDVVADVAPALLIGARFLVSALAFLPFVRLNSRLLRDGALLGVVAIASYASQVYGLELISANRAAFITSLNVMMVPILGAFLGQAIAPRVGLAAGLALAGIGVMSWEGGAFGWGDLWVLGCAVTYAVYILLAADIAPRHPPLALTAIQLLAIALVGMGWAAPTLATEWSVLQHHWPTIVYLGLAATAITTLIQMMAQRHLSATEAAIIYTLEPVFATLFSFWWLGEQLGLRGFVGGGMVLVAMLLSQIKPESALP